jgi:hypothetical protein
MVQSLIQYGKNQMIKIRVLLFVFLIPSFGMALQNPLDELSISYLETFNGISLVLNEISPNTNQCLSDEYGEYDDWIEIHNPTSVDLNIAGWYISDTLDFSMFHRIPSYDPEKTLIPAGGFLILWADGQSAQGVIHLPFKLEKDGEEVILAKSVAGSLSVVDHVVFSKTKNDVTYGRIPDGTGQWMRLSDPTPGFPNLPARVIDGFLLNELMAVAGQGVTDEFGEAEDWIEFYNPTEDPIDLGGLYITDSLSYPLQSHVSVFSPDSTTIPPGGYLMFYADNQTWQGARHLSFKLAAKSGSIYVFQPDGDTKITEVQYPFQAGDASFGRFPLGSEKWHYTIPTPCALNRYEFTPVNGLFINEIMADNNTTITDNSGHFEDWVEIYNSNDVPVNLGGLYLTDSLANMIKYRIPNTSPDSTTIPGKGFMVFWADNRPSTGVHHLDFKLSAAGESIGLAQVLKSGEHAYIDSITFPAQSGDISYGRFGDGEMTWSIFRTPTPNSSNNPQSVVSGNLDSHKLEVFPNPFSSNLNIKVLSQKATNLQIDFLDSQGITISSHRFIDCSIGWNSFEIEFNNRMAKSGFYSLRVLSGEEVSYHKVLYLK